MSQQINLLNPLFVKQKKYFSALAMLQNLGLLLLGTLLFYFFALYQVGELRNLVAQGEKQLASEQARQVKLAGQYGLQQKNQLLEDEVNHLAARLQARQQAAQTLQSGAIGNTEGYAEYMRAFARQAIDGLWLTGFSIVGAGSEISLSGRVLEAELVPAYLQRLNHESLLQGKPFSALQIRQPQDVAKSGLAYLEFNLQSAAPGASSGNTP